MSQARVVTRQVCLRLAAKLPRPRVGLSLFLLFPVCPLLILCLSRLVPSFPGKAVNLGRLCSPSSLNTMVSYQRSLARSPPPCRLSKLDSVASPSSPSLFVFLVTASLQTFYQSRRATQMTHPPRRVASQISMPRYLPHPLLRQRRPAARNDSLRATLRRG